MDSVITGIGTVAYFGTASWLAHIIVHPDYRRQGIAAAIVDRLLEHSRERKFNTSCLIATKIGQSVYRRAGFKDVSEYYFMDRVAAPKHVGISKAVVNYSPDHRDAIMSLDKQATGEDRSIAIDDFLQYARVYVGNSGVEGFFLPGLGEGPIIARTERAGYCLLDFKLQTADKVRIPTENEVATDYLIAKGFAITERIGYRMVLGEVFEWQPEMIYSRIGGNFG